MAESLSHSWGQKIGEVLELAILGLLAPFAEKHTLYLDRHGDRPARAGRKASWRDINGNKHDLDYVLEKGGTPYKIGVPVAFIETAWRRYTKHSRNKAQEIQGAILPLVETHRNSAPFIGAILAGVFTEGAKKQLESLRFEVLYFPYDSITKAFARVGIDAGFDETTPEESFRAKLDAWATLTFAQRQQVSAAILEMHRQQIENFLGALERSVLRTVTTVFVLPLHGAGGNLPSINAAMKFISEYDESTCNLPVMHYIVQVRYSTGEQIEGKFTSKESALDFLRSYQPPPLAPAASN